MKYLLLTIVLLISASCYSPEPVPTCTWPAVQQKDIPISLKETQHYDMDDYFKGFNLKFNLSQSAPSFVHMPQKLQQVKQNPIKQPGLKSYHLEHIGNDWGRTIVTLAEQGFKSTVRWGRLAITDFTPTFEDPVVVQTKENVFCYDATWFSDINIIMVDCSRTSGNTFSNIFLYVNTSSKAAIDKQVPNDLYVKFEKMRWRRTVSHVEDGYKYLLRAYFADAVDDKHDHNTYLEFISVQDPFKPFTLKVMDRSFLHQDKLAINDFKMYRGDAYLLDEHSGVIKFDIASNHQIIIVGRYRTDSGFHKMSIFTSNYDRQVLLVLANNHAIYEIDWSNQIYPKIIAKYSIFQDSFLASLWVNQQYVVAEVIAKVADHYNQTLLTQYNATLIFNRGTRTYTNAYAFIPHRSQRAAVDFNRNHSWVMTIDEQGVKTYALSSPIVEITPIDPATLGRQFSFDVTALSENPYTSHSSICSYKLIFTVVEADSKLLYPTGLQIPGSYYANYPGLLAIPLDKYVLGPNITWGVHEQSVIGQKPTHWILQQNETLIRWNKQPSFGRITFLRQQQYDSIDQNDLYIYTQDIFNTTHMVKCRTIRGTKNINCDDDSKVSVGNRSIANLTANRFQYYQGQYLHLAAVVFSDNLNQVHIYDVQSKTPFIKQPLVMGQSYQGRISSIQFLGSYLAVVLRYTKQIVFYNMIQCKDADYVNPKCKVIYKLDSIAMDKVGVQYFSPVDIYASDFHPSMLFIQCTDRVLIVDFAPDGIHLMAEVISPGTLEPGFYKYKIAISQDHLIIVNSPDIIEEHTLAFLYTNKRADMMKKYPTYNYSIPDKFDLDFSDAGNLFYITGIDKQLPNNTNSVIMVYRAGYPAVASFYDVFHLYGSYSQLLIDATGNFQDYVGIAMGSIFTIIRQYEVPVLVFESPYVGFRFNITYSNDKDEDVKHRFISEVKIANSPQRIQVVEGALNDNKFFTNRIDYQNDDRQYKFWDHKWFNGSVINYTLDCGQCDKKLEVVNHLEDKRHIIGSLHMNDYVFTDNGGVIQQYQSAFRMRHNGSIHDHIEFPSIISGENCKFVAYSFFYQFVASACVHQNQVFLYVTTLSSLKPFTMGPFQSSASAVASIQIMQDILIVVDVDENPSIQNRDGGVMIYAINHDPFQVEVYDELQEIDTDDLIAANGWPGGPAFIGNAHLAWTNSSTLYRLFITEVKHGMFLVDFKYSKTRNEIQVTKVSFLNLNDILAKQNLHMPNMAFFEAVSIVSQFYDTTFKYWQIEVVVTTRNFHNFQFHLQIDQTGNVQYCLLNKIYYRYGFYETTNYVKTFDGYIAITQKVPRIYEQLDMFSKQVLTIYDSRPKRDENGSIMNFHRFQDTQVNATWMLGGMTYPLGRISYDFNFTFRRNQTDPFRDLGLLVLDSEQRRIKEVNINDELQFRTRSGINDDINTKLIAQNDFSKISFDISVLIGGGLPGWAIALIVIGSVALAVGGGFVAFMLYKRKKQNTVGTSQASQSLLQSEGQNENESQSSEQSEEDGQQQDEQQEDVPEQQPQEKKVEQQPVETNDPNSINRETIASNFSEPAQQKQEKGNNQQ